MRFWLLPLGLLLACDSSSVAAPITTPPVTVGDAASPVDAAVVDAADAAPAPFTSIWNGTDFTGWDRWLGTPVDASAPLGLENDPKGVFSVASVDGEPAIHVTGEVFGALTSKDEHANYELQLEYKWCAMQFPPLTGMDSGVMVFSTGAFGAVNAGGDALSSPAGSGGFMVSIEFQIAGGDVGGLYNLGPITIVPAPRAQLAEIPNAWNQINILARGSSSQHFLNGQLVTSGSGYTLHLPGEEMVPLTRGKIQLQSEGHEIYFRRVGVRDLP